MSGYVASGWFFFLCLSGFKYFHILPLHWMVLDEGVLFSFLSAFCNLVQKQLLW